MKSIEDHIKKDKDIVDDPLANPAARRHAKEELHDLEEYAEHHKEEIEAGAVSYTHLTLPTKRIV